jgi:hypothetical protein
MQPATALTATRNAAFFISVSSSEAARRFHLPNGSNRPTFFGLLDESCGGRLQALSPLLHGPGTLTNTTYLHKLRDRAFIFMQ